MRIGDLIRTRREMLGISKAELARRAGVTPPVITRIESGENIPKIGTMVSVAGVLGIDSDEAFRVMRSDPKARQPPVGNGRRPITDLIRELYTRMGEITGETDVVLPPDADESAWARGSIPREPVFA